MSVQKHHVPFSAPPGYSQEYILTKNHGIIAQAETTPLVGKTLGTRTLCEVDPKIWIVPRDIVRILGFIPRIR